MATKSTKKPIKNSKKKNIHFCYNFVNNCSTNTNNVRLLQFNVSVVILCYNK